jgi:hypothetical protein
MIALTILSRTTVVGTYLILFKECTINKNLWQARGNIINPTPRLFIPGINRLGTEERAVFTNY